MKLLRHILSHLLLISFLVAVVSVFYYRTLLLPNEMVGKIDNVVNDVYPPALAFVSKREYFWSIKGERIVSFDDLNLFKKDDAATKEEVKIADAKPEKSEQSVVVETGKTNLKKEVKEVKEIKEDKREPVEVAKIDVDVPVENPANTNNEKIAEVVDVNKLPLEVKDSDTSSERNLLIDARQAFNQGKVVASEKLYIELTQLEQDNPDAFGELGNVYYSQGKWNKAGQAYYEAAVRLIAEGKYNQVSYLQRVISGLDREHAEKLSQLMMRR